MAEGEKKKKNRLANLRSAFSQYKRLAPYVFPYWTRVVFFMSCVLAVALGNGGRLLAVKPLMLALGDTKAAETASGDPLSDLLLDYGYWGIAGLIIGSTLLMSLGTWGKQYNMAWLSTRATVDVQRQLAGRIMSQPMTFFNTTNKGELLSRLTNDLNGVRASIQIIYNDLISHPIQILVFLGGAVYTSPVLALTTLAVPLILAPVLIYANKIKRLSKRSYESHAELTSIFHQYFEGVRVIKAYAMEKQQDRAIDAKAGEYFKRSIKVGKYQGGAKALVEIIMGFLLAGGMMLGLYVVNVGIMGIDLTQAELIQFMAFLFALYDPLRRFSNMLGDMAAAMAANERVFELMDRTPEFKDTDDAKPAPTLKQTIEFDHVSFEYLAGRPVVRDISLVAKQGTMTAFVGATGAGKSTLMDLIPRFYLPTKGRILIDGHDLQGYTQESWLAQIAVVEQETFLFNASVRENLNVAREEATEADLIEALKAANIYDEVMDLPNGLDTQLGDRGVMLSGGQRQRLAIARAFVKRAPILLLDEATSALDSETERKVQDALDRLIEGATVFAIAHRLSTIRHADQIVVIDQGEIVEVGRHEDLLAAGGRYAMLYQSQFQSAKGGKAKKEEEA